MPDGSRLNPPFEGDIIEAALSLKATTQTVAMFANYGITDRWDVGLAVPFVRVSLDASVTARIIRLVTNPPPDAPLTAQQRRDALDLHTFEVGNPNATRTVVRSDSATGLGDIVLRSKYRFLRIAGGGLAAAVDMRLPTSDEAELLGAGGVQAKLLLVASSERGRFGQHVNVGYTAADGRVAGTLFEGTAAAVPNEINYSGGVEFVASPRLTLIGDIVGRTLRGVGRLNLVAKSFQYNTPPLPSEVGPGCGGFVGFVCRSASFDEFSLEPGNLTLLLATGGVKFNPVGNLLFTGSVLFPLTTAGLRSRVTTVIGIDYAF
jgi:hypothetical protein